MMDFEDDPYDQSYSERYAMQIAEQEWIDQFGVPAGSEGEP